MIKISANLGFLFREHSLADAIGMAKHAGFSAVEMHWPYDTSPEMIASALARADLPLLGINTQLGNTAAGEFGLSAVPGREVEAREAIDRAVNWGAIAGTRNIHVMAGRSSGEAAFSCFCENLKYAVGQASSAGIGVLIEPLNPRDAPEYFLSSLDMAMRLREAVGDGVKVMFDCYHMQIVQGDLLRAIERCLPAIGHVQFAAVPDRTEPDHGEVDYNWLLRAIADIGYEGFFGAEYKPGSGSFDWMASLR